MPRGLDPVDDDGGVDLAAAGQPVEVVGQQDVTRQQPLEQGIELRPVPIAAAQTSRATDATDQPAFLRPARQAASWVSRLVLSSWPAELTRQ